MTNTETVFAICVHVYSEHGTVEASCAVLMAKRRLEVDGKDVMVTGNRHGTQIAFLVNTPTEVREAIQTIRACGYEYVVQKGTRECKV